MKRPNFEKVFKTNTRLLNRATKLRAMNHSKAEDAELKYKEYAPFFNKGLDLELDRLLASIGLEQRNGSICKRTR